LTKSINDKTSIENPTMMAKEYQKTSKPKKPFNEGNKAKTNQKKKKTKNPWIWTLFSQDQKPQNDWGSKGRPKKKRKKKSQKTIDLDLF
jgi:hypothetical protein